MCVLSSHYDTTTTVVDDRRGRCASVIGRLWPDLAFALCAHDTGLGMYE